MSKHSERDWERERLIVAAFDEGKPTPAIAREWDISRERVRQILERNARSPKTRPVPRSLPVRSRKPLRLGLVDRFHLNAPDGRLRLDRAEERVRERETDFVVEQIAPPDYVEVWEISARPALARRYEREENARIAALIQAERDRPKREAAAREALWLTPEYRVGFARRLAKVGVLDAAGLEWVEERYGT